jgi:GNAT superfamily N-acetyltransferase
MGLGPETAGRPPGYPQEYQREMTLRDGRLVLIRPVLPGDAPELADAIKTADADTLRSRFLGGAPRVTPTLLAHLTVADYVHRFALVAIDAATGRGVAIARYEPDGEGVADVAVVVRPEWQRVGLATALVLLLATSAVEHGIHNFRAANRPVAALVEDADGLGRQVIKQGIAEFSLEHSTGKDMPQARQAQQRGTRSPARWAAQSKPASPQAGGTWHSGCILCFQGVQSCCQCWLCALRLRIPCV